MTQCTARHALFRATFSFTGAEKHQITTGGEKAKIEGQSVWRAKHVREVRFHAISDNIRYCFVDGRVVPQKAITSAPYYTWVALHRTLDRLYLHYAHAGQVFEGSASTRLPSFVTLHMKFRREQTKHVHQNLSSGISPLREARRFMSLIL